MNKILLYTNDRYRLEFFSFSTTGFGSTIELSRNIMIIDNKTSNIQSMRPLKNFTFIISDYEHEFKFIDFCIESQLFIVSKEKLNTVFECNNALKLKLL